MSVLKHLRSDHKELLLRLKESVDIVSMYTLIEDIGRDSFVSFHLIQYLKIVFYVKSGCEKFNVFNHFARR